MITVLVMINSGTQMVGIKIEKKETRNSHYMDAELQSGLHNDLAGACLSSKKNLV